MKEREEKREKGKKKQKQTKKGEKIKNKGRDPFFSGVSPILKHLTPADS